MSLRLIVEDECVDLIGVDEGILVHTGYEVATLSPEDVYEWLKRVLPEREVPWQVAAWLGL